MMGCSWCVLPITVYMCFSAVHSYPVFQTRIPNGQRVPNPCNASKLWNGVGHKNDEGAGPLNPFGLQFDRNNYVCYPFLSIELVLGFELSEISW